MDVVVERTYKFLGIVNFTMHHDMTMTLLNLQEISTAMINLFINSFRSHSAARRCTNAAFIAGSRLKA